MDADFQREIDAIIGKCKKVVSDIDERTIKDILLYAGQPFIETAKRKAPKSRREHFRYSTPKLIGKFRAPNGKGVRIASYTPGNLGRSVKVIATRRLKRAILIGPKVARGKGKGRFASSSKVDGYYSTFVEFGTKKQGAKGFLKSSYESTKSTVLRRLKTSLLNQINKQIQKQGLGSG